MAQIGVRLNDLSLALGRDAKFLKKVEDNNRGSDSDDRRQLLHRVARSLSLVSKIVTRLRRGLCGIPAIIGV